MLKDLMHAIFDEDIEDEDVEEETVEPVEEQAAVTVQPVVQNTNTSIDTVVEELEKNQKDIKIRLFLKRRSSKNLRKRNRHFLKV